MITSKKGKEMIQRITPMYQESIIEQAIYEAIGHEFDTADKLAKEVLLQLFPQTATWGLTFWEQRVGLTTNTNEDIQRRRRKVIAKMQTRYPINPYKMAEIIKNSVGVKVLVVEHIEDYVFELDINEDIKFDLVQLRKIVDKLKPSHLGYLIRYVVDYIIQYKTKKTIVINNTIGFHNSAYNIPTHLLLNGIADLNGEYYLSGAIRPDGIKKTFYFITEKAFSHLVVNNTINIAINSFISVLSKNSITTKCSGESYRFKALNGKYKLNGEIDLSNKSILLENI